MNRPNRHVVVRLAHGFVTGLWALLAGLGAIMVSPVLAIFEIPAMRRYVRMEAM